jgi:hypothetical protein
MPPVQKLVGQTISQVCFQPFYISLYLDGGDSVMSYYREDISRQFAGEEEIISLIGETVQRALFDLESNDTIIEIERRIVTFHNRGDGLQSYDLTISGELYPF